MDKQPIDQLKPADYNPRKISASQLDKLKASIEEFGFVEPVVVNKDNTIISGHQRMKAAQALGMTEVPVVRVDVPKGKEKALNIAMNRISGEWDEEKLKELLSELDPENKALSGFEEDELAAMLQEAMTVEEDDFDGEPPEEPKAMLGDIYQLGEHRLMCGDATSKEDVEKLMDGEKADMVFTDPPYLMAFDGGINEKGEKSKTGGSHDIIMNDQLSKEDGWKLLVGFSKIIKQFNRGAFYVTFYRLGIDQMMNALTEAGLKWRNLVIWRKNNHNLSNSDYKSLYEPVIVGFADDYVPILYGWGDEHPWYGDHSGKDVWEIEMPSVIDVDKTKKNDLHPTMKPLALMNKCMQNSSKAGDIVLDLFGGSGSTLIACEQTNRKCYMMELDPKYVDVIINRWEGHTSKKAIKL